MVVGDIKQQIMLRIGDTPRMTVAEELYDLCEQHFIDKHCVAIGKLPALAGSVSLVCIQDVEQAIRESKSIKGGTE